MNALAVLVSADSSELDPWHVYAETSPLLAEILEQSDLSVDIRVADVHRMPAIGDADLLVINAGVALCNKRDSTGRVALRDHVEAGRPVLAMHAATAGLREFPEWPSIVGARWVNGQSFHPPLGLGNVDVLPDHPLMHGIDSFSLFDELYTSLDLEPGNTILATHEVDSVKHPIIWTRTRGASSVVYDALGHDARSYESAAHRAIIGRAARFLTAARGPSQ